MLLVHCAHARFVWNLAVEQHRWWRPGRKAAPGYLAQSRQLTAARAEHLWLAEGAYAVQREALRDFDKAMRAFYKGSRGRPSWRKASKDEGFGFTGPPGRGVRRVSRRWGQVWVPKIGWVRFRWSKAVSIGLQTYRVTRDPSGRWHIAFMCIPDVIEAPGNGKVVGIDRGVAVSAALSTGELLQVPRLTRGETRRMRRLERKLARARPGSNRRKKVKTAVAKLKARQADKRKDWVEKLSTTLAREFDLIRLENLKVAGMTKSAKGTADFPGRNVRAKAGLNRGILGSAWGVLARRLEDKAPGRVEKVPPAYTSQRCSACGHVAAENRKSQADFACRVCGFACNADVNAARNIAAGRAVTARGGYQVTGPVNREPQLLLQLV
jgi:putative transposase